MASPCHRLDQAWCALLVALPTEYEGQRGQVCNNDSRDIIGL